MTTGDLKNTSRCEAIRARLTLFVLNDLDARTQETIRFHLDDCEDCRTLEHQVRETLGSLQDALTAGSRRGVAVALTPERRRRIRAASARSRLSLWSRMLKSPGMKIAASVVIGYLIVSLLMPSMVVSRKSASLVMPSQVDVGMIAATEWVEDLESHRDIAVLDEQEQTVAQGFKSVAVGGALSSLASELKVAAEYDTGMPADMPAAALEPPPPVALPEQTRPAAPKPVAAPPASASRPLASRLEEASSARKKERAQNEVGDYRAAQSAAPMEAPEKAMASKGFSGPLPDSGRVEPPAETAVVQPAEFDSVAMAKSPVVMRGLFGKRSEGKREGAGGGGSLADVDNDIAIDIVEGGDRSDRQRMNAPASAAPEAAPVPAGATSLALASVGRSSGEKRSENKEKVAADKLQELSKSDVLALDAGGISGDIRQSEVAVDEEKPDAFAPRFKATGVNPFVPVAGNAFSTFSIDVDTASYTLARNYMLDGHLPPAEAVRTEEFVNFFDYAYEPPIGDPFRVVAETAPSRFGRGLHLLKIGVKGRRLGREEQRPASLTFLVDSSGSMNQPDRLGLVRAALELLLDGLAATDQVAIIQFDTQARLILEHTPVSERSRILEAVNAIQCGGGTNLEEGLRRAYEQASRSFVSRGENRILLMSDGVVNMGETAGAAILEKVETYRRQGLYLSVFGFGMGIYDDDMLKTLASKGNGAYAFIDSEQEARRVFVDDLSATLNTIAEDVKIQVEYNPALVKRYRQLGYESRQLTKEQFRDDTVDAGEVGSGQSVTALYELDLAPLPPAVPMPYPSPALRGMDDRWLAVVRVRYRRVDNGRTEEIEQRIHERDIVPSFDAASTRFRLAAGVAAFAEILRGSPFAQGVGFADVATVLRPVALDLHLDSRIRELVQMVETAGGLTR